MINFKVVTPNGVTYEDEIEKVAIPTQSGEIVVLENHAAMVSILRPGEMTIYKDGGKTTELAVSGGVLEIRDGGEVYIMADTAERAEHIDVARAEEARERAEDLLKQQKDISDVDFARIQAMIEKEVARIGVAKKYRN